MVYGRLSARQWKQWQEFVCLFLLGRGRRAAQEIPGFMGFWMPPISHVLKGQLLPGSHWALAIFDASPCMSALDLVAYDLWLICIWHCGAYTAKARLIPPREGLEEEGKKKRKKAAQAVKSTPHTWLRRQWRALCYVWICRQWRALCYVGSEKHSPYMAM